MNQEIIKKAAAQMLVAYCDALNEFNREDNFDCPDYTPKTFSRQEGNYGSLSVISVFETVDYKALIMNVNSGDEGGPATLIGFFEVQYEDTPNEEWTLNHMIQQFDMAVWKIWTTDNPKHERKSFYFKEDK